MSEVINLQLPYGYTARPYQVKFWEAMRSGKKRAVLVWHRRAGKEKTCWNYLVMKAAMQRGIYYYFFPFFSQARKILWDGIDKQGNRFLEHIPTELIQGNRNNTEMKLWLKNGSLIQMIGVDNIDSIVGTNPIGCVFSEYSVQDPNAWQFIRPILAENKGWAVFNFCVDSETLVFTEEGLQKIKNVVPGASEGFTDLSLDVYGLEGYNKSTQFYSGGKKKLLKITTEKGYEIRCTPNHQLWSLEHWKRADAWCIGDIIPIQRGQDCWGKGIELSDFQKPEKRKSHKDLPAVFDLDEDLAYLLGLILAEGSWDENSVTVTTGDVEIADWLIDRGFKGYSKFHYKYCSQEFVAFIEWMGLIRGAKNKKFPDKILRCTKPIVSAFICGYFDGDGCATKRGGIHCDSVSKELIDTLQIVLLNYGIICSKRLNIVKPTKKAKVTSYCYRLELTVAGSFLFFKECGFRLSRKQKRLENIRGQYRAGDSDQIPFDKQWAREYFRGMNRGWMHRQSSLSYKKARELLKIKNDEWLEQVVKSNFFYDKVKTIEECEGEVFDFVIPETHSFCTNGIISHNTPRGQNHAKDLFDMAKFNPEWFTQLLTVEDTNVLSQTDIQRERDAGMSEDMIQQEYYCSFSLGIEGSYYAYYMQTARDESRIGNVPYDRHAKVHTAWDIGYGDSCAIIFFQIIGNEIHIIDCIEDHGKSVAHYIQLINEKNYIYGDHFGPHDIANRHFSSGLSTKEVAADLGFEFIQLPTLRMTIEEGIEACRSIFPRVWIDERKCKDLIKAMENYRKEFDDKHTVYKERPLHNWASHFADAYRYLSIAVKTRVDRVKIGINDAEAERLFQANCPSFK